MDFEDLPKEPEKLFNHFSQVVWKGTTHMGIGYASNEKKCTIVAQYLPQGNMDGLESFKANVKPLQ